ncbi:EAL domain-containing protein [Marinomonas sp. PE14-40]|uniref:EAL domain-containing protein n=1 Tax=Marinomonas sp. PE14-40 TaxID=3060621 RepID=UPI003F6775B4
MNTPKITLGFRFIFSALLVLALLCSLGFYVINSLSNIRSIIDYQSNQHINKLAINSSVSREMFVLSNRIQLLEQSLLYDKEILNKEGQFIEQKLNEIRTLSDSTNFSQLTDVFIRNFHRFIDNSLSLNQILRELKSADEELLDILEALDLSVSENHLMNVLRHEDSHITTPGDNFHTSNNVLEGAITRLQVTYLTIGKLTATIRSRITPDTEEVLIIEIENQLDIFELHLSNLNGLYSPIIENKLKTKQSLEQYRQVLKKLQNKLAQRWRILSSLAKSEDELLTQVEKTEGSVKFSAILLKNQLKTEIQTLRLEVIYFAGFILIFSGIIFIRQIHKHIKSPIKTIITRFNEIEADQFNQVIQLQRQDEWNTIEKAFNKMSRRLDETYQELQAERIKLNHLAHHDVLTGLANRLQVYQDIEHCIKKSQQTGAKFGLLFLDIDQFKHVNDSLGHGMGDQLLKLISKRLRETVASDGIVARLGGDEFMIIYPDEQNRASLQDRAEELNCILNLPFELNANSVFAGSSIGVCLYPEHGDTLENLVSNADVAMYHAKRKGRNTYSVYQAEMSTEAHKLLQLSSGIRKAIENDEFFIHYQPQYNLITDEIVGAEALIRWNHPEMGLITPDNFLPIAEKTGIITEIDTWVFTRVVKQISQWKEEGVDLTDKLFSINFSARKFLSPDLPDELIHLLEKYNCPTNCITIEITEQDLVANLDDCSEAIIELQYNGFRVAIDDFGIGYSSLNYLKRLPAQCLKIDKTFVSDLDAEKQGTDSAIVNAIISLGSNMSLTLIAEGIETEQQKQSLIQQGCHLGQGYHLSYPILPDELSKLMRINVKSA